MLCYLICLFLLNRSGKDIEANFSGTSTIKDEIIRLHPIKVSAKIKGLSIIMGRNGELRVCYNKNFYFFFSKIQKWYLFNFYSVLF